MVQNNQKILHKTITEYLGNYTGKGLENILHVMQFKFIKHSGAGVNKLVRCQPLK